MNKIIFTTTAVIALALVASTGTVKTSEKTSMKRAFVVQKTSKRTVPAEKDVPYRQPLCAVEVTDEALEELRKFAKLSNTAWPNKIYKLQ